MRGVLIGAAVVLACPSMARTADDVMAGYFGNTVISKGPFGEAHIHFKADHTFYGSARTMFFSMDFKGTWTIDEKGQLCRIYDTPPPGRSNPLCGPAEAHKPGDTWTMDSRPATLVKGIQ